MRANRPEGSWRSNSPGAMLYLDSVLVRRFGCFFVLVVRIEFVIRSIMSFPRSGDFGFPYGEGKFLLCFWHLLYPFDSSSALSDFMHHIEKIVDLAA